MNLTKTKICKQVITKVSISEFTIYVCNQQLQPQHNHDTGNNIAHTSSLGHRFPNFLAHRHLWLRKIIMDPHPHTQCPDNRYPKLIFCISELLLVRY
jgi:hypothetical protein